MLSVISSRQRQPESVLRELQRQAAPAAPAPLIPGTEAPAGTQTQPAPATQPAATPEGGAAPTTTTGQ
jgi:hypothetical protein